MLWNSVSARRALVEKLKKKGIEDERVLSAFLEIPREIFLPAVYHPLAYEDCPITIHHNITTSAPSTIAFMVENLLVGKDSKVLEIGTGSGYETAILALLSKEVFTIERIKSLGISAKERILGLGLKNVHFRIGDGFFGWEEERPFDRIIISACSEGIPPPLVAQLKDGGRAVYPMKRGEKQFIYLCIKLGEKIKLRPLQEANFSLLVRRAGA